MKCTYLVFALILVSGVIAQPSSTYLPQQRLTISDGLPQNYVTEIVEDRYGYLWMSSLGGLVRYDGMNFLLVSEVLESGATFSGDQIFDLFLTGDELFIVYADRKVDVLDVNTFTVRSNIRPLARISKDSFQLRFNWETTNRIIQDQNRSWFIDDANYYYLFDSALIFSRIGQIFARKRHQNSFINSFLLEGDSMWVFSNIDLTLFVGDSASVRSFTLPDSLGFAPNDVASQEFLYRVYRHYLFFGYRSDLYLFDSIAGTFQKVQLPLESFSPENGIKKIVFDSQERPYFIYADKVFRLEPDFSFSLIWTYPGNGVFLLRTIFIDSQDQLWLGSDGDGLYRVDLTSPTFFQYEIETNYAVDILRDYEGYEKQTIPSNWNKIKKSYGFRFHNGDRRFVAFEKWYGNSESNLYEQLDDDIRLVKPPSQRNEYNFNLYIGIDQCADTLEAVTISGIYDRWIDKEQEPIRKRILVGLFEKLDEDPADPSRKKINRDLVHFLSDQEALWLLTKEKLIKITRDGEKVVKEIPDKSGNFVYMVEDPSSDTILWIGSISRGLFKFNKKTCRFSKRFSIESGLVNNNITGIIPDRKGNLWIATFNGISVFDPESESFRNFTSPNGLDFPEFNRHHAYKLKNGWISFGGSTHLTLFDPDLLTASKSSPLPRFTKLTLNDSTISQRNLDWILNDTSRSLVLSHNLNNIKVGFSSLDFRGNNQQQFRYRLEGGANRWLMLDDKSSLRLDNLKPGSYRLLLNGGTNGQGWHAEYASFDFEIQPPAWLSWWAKSLYAVLVLVAGFIAVRAQKNKIVARNEREFREKELARGKELLEVKNRLFANITHEFRTPLTLIMSPTQAALRSNDLSAEVQKLLKSNYSNAENMLNLVNQLLEAAKLESSQMKAKYFLTNINHFLNTLIDHFRKHAERKEINLEVQGQSVFKPFQIEREFWERIVNNILSNALKFTPSGGTVAVKYRLIEGGEKTYIDLRVSDTGPGIAEEEREKIFTRFYQIESASDRRYEGTGIGLSLVKELIDLIGGTVQVESMVGEGSTFILRLPIYEIKIDNKLAESEDVFRNAAGDSFIILIVEDNNELRSLIRDSLKGNFQIIEAKDGGEASTYIEDHLPDLVISDVMMPVMDGFDLCRKIKDDLRFSHIGVFLLTAKAAESSLIEGLRSGADEYIPKPFNIEELQLRVGNFFSQRERLKNRIKEAIISDENNLNELQVKDEFKDAIDQIIHRNLDNSALKVEDIARELAMSKSTLNRKMKSVFGLSCKEYCRQIRISRSVLFLKQGFSVSQTSYMVGFDNPSYYTTCFKEKFGYNPSEYISRSTKR